MEKYLFKLCSMTVPADYKLLRGVRRVVAFWQFADCSVSWVLVVQEEKRA